MRKLDRPSILRHVMLAGSRDARFFGGLYNTGYRLMAAPGELTDLVMLLQGTGRRFRRYLEIGPSGGGIPRLLDDFLTFNAVHLIADDCEPDKTKTLGVNLPHGLVWHGDGSSAAAEHQLASWGGGFDLVHIDAEHSYESVRRQTQMVLPYLTRDALLIFHDTSFAPGVGQWVRELKGGEMCGMAHLGDFGDKFGFSVFQFTQGSHAAASNPPEPLPTRNLIFHWCGLRSDMLDFNFAELPKYLDAFDGRVVFTVAWDQTTMAPFDVIDRFDSEMQAAGTLRPVEWIPVANQPNRETHAFKDHLLPRAMAWDGYTAFGHSKGTTHGGNYCVRLWTDWLYQFTFSNPRAVHAMLRDKTCAGALKSDLKGTYDSDATDARFRVSHDAVQVPWEYSGTFFWLNNARAFSKPLKPFRDGRWSIESFPGSQWPKSEGACLFDPPRDGRGYYVPHQYRSLGGGVVIENYKRSF